MALAQVFLGGVAMFSDMGIRDGIIRDRRGEDETFLNTAWTIQVLRGVLMWAVICLLAWPAGVIYEEPDLVAILPIIGIASILSGFESTSRFSLERDLRPQRRIQASLAAQLAAFIVMICVAWFYRSVWALVAGWLVHIAIVSLASHFFIPSYKNHFCWDPEAVRSLFHFGKWIFFSTALAFVIGQGDRLILGKLFTSAELGVYSIAFLITQTPIRVLNMLSSSVLFPVYSQLARRGKKEFRHKLYQLRAGLMMATLPVAWVLTIFGQQIVTLLYDDRYADAGWMMQLLGVGMVGQIVVLTTEKVLLVHGSSFRYMVLQICRSVLFFAGIALGFAFADITGLLMGISISRWLQYIAVAVLVRPYGVWLPKLDAFALGSSLIIFGVYFAYC